MFKEKELTEKFKNQLVFEIQKMAANKLIFRMNGIIIQL